MSAQVGSESGRALTTAGVASSAPRFWRKVITRPGDECWEWVGTRRTPDGYGCISVEGRVEQAHRVTLALAGYDIPPGVLVLHACDNKWCVNPRHLRLGTQLENRADAMARGQARGVPGNTNNAKLSPAAVVEMKKRRAAGTRLRVLAEMFNVSEAAVSMACAGRTWATC